MRISGNGVLRLELSRDAHADLIDILDFGSTVFGDRVSKEYFFGIDKSLKILREYPESGARAWNLRGDIRRWAYRSHRIFYRYDDATLYVGRILHHSMDVDPDLSP